MQYKYVLVYNFTVDPDLVKGYHHHIASNGMNYNMHPPFVPLVSLVGSKSLESHELYNACQSIDWSKYKYSELPLILPPVKVS